MIIKTVNTPEDLSSLVDESASASAQSEKITLNRLLYIMETLQNSMQRMQRSLNSRTELELHLIKACNPTLDTSSSALLERIVELEKSFSSSKPSNPQFQKEDISSALISRVKNLEEKFFSLSSDFKKVVDSSSNINSNNQVKLSESCSAKTISATSSVDMESLRDNAVLMKDWSSVLDQLKRHSIALFSAFKDSTAYLSDDFVLIDTDNEFAFTLLRESAKREEMRLAIHKVTGKKFRLGPFRDPKKLKQTDDPLKEFEDFIKKTGIEST